MDGVLEGAVALCVCKLACSLLFLPSLATSYNSVSVCCCCLLLFTDFQVTAFLTWICFFDSCLTETSPAGDVIALRFLLFLSHTYEAVLLLSTFLIAIETLIRLLWPHTIVNPDSRKENLQKEVEFNVQKKDRNFYHGAGFFCCLLMWVIVALNVMWRWKVEEMRAADCLQRTESLVRCLPNLRVTLAINPGWIIVFLFLFLLLVTIGPGQERRCWIPTQTENPPGEKQDDYRHQNFISVLSAPFKPRYPEMSAVETKLCVDPEKSDRSANKTCCWNNTYMSTCHHGEFVFTSTDCYFGKRGGEESENTKRASSLTSIKDPHIDFPHGHSGLKWWGFPSLEVDVMIGLGAVFSIFMLPFNLSVNILLIRTIDFWLEWCIASLLLHNTNNRHTQTSHSGTQV